MCGIQLQFYTCFQQLQIYVFLGNLDFMTRTLHAQAQKDPPHQ